MSVPCRRSLLIVVAVLLAQAVPVSAAEIDQYLPNDTEAVRTANMRLLLDSALMKKYAVPKLEELLKSSDELQKVLKELNFDPLKDLDTYIEGTGGGGIENFLLILHGKFDQAKIEARVAKLVKEMPELLKMSKVGNQTMFELTLPFEPLPGIKSFFFAILDGKSAVASANKAYMLEAFDKKAGKKTTTLRKEIKDLVEKVDGKQTLWAAAVPNALVKGPIREGIPKEFLDILDQTSHVWGGITITDEVKGEMTLVTKDAATAKTVTTLTEKFLADVKKMAGDDPQGKAVMEALLSNFKIQANDKVVTAGFRVTNKDVEKIVTAFK